MPPGLSDRASDPVVAYSAKHGVWLISGLAIQNGIATRLTMHRSRDGIAWSGPVEAAISQTAELAYDKQWLTCDNGTSSPYRGRCYLAYTDLQASGEVFALQRSDDGGLTWSPPVTSPIYLTGVIPVVQPTGRLVISSWAQAAQTIVAITSNDGGVTLGRARPDQRPADAERAAVPRTAAAWRRSWIEAAASSSPGRTAGSAPRARRTTSCSPARHDGATWSAPQRVTSGRNAVMPTIGVEPATGRLAILYYSLFPTGADVELVTSADGVRWSAPQRLNARRMSFDWMPQTTLGRMLADYIGVTWSRGRPVAVYAHALPAAERRATNGDLRHRPVALRASGRPVWPPATDRPGARPVFSSRKLEIAHGLCSSAVPWTTRLTLSAASRSSSAARPSAPVTSIAFTSMWAASIGRELVPGAGEQVDDAAGKVGRRDRLRELDRRQRHASPTRGTTTALPPTIAGATRDTSPSSAGSSGARIATTPVGSGTVKLKYGPATGFERAEHLRQLVRPARVPDDAIDRPPRPPSCPSRRAARSPARASIISARRYSTCPRLYAVAPAQLRRRRRGPP